MQRSAAAGAALVVASALAFALDGPMARAAYQQGLDPAAFGFWRALAVVGLVLLIRPDPLISVPAAGLLLALLAAVLHAAYILLGRDGWGEIGDGAATFLIVATAAAGLGALTAVTRPATVLVPVTDLRLSTLLLLEGALAGAAAPLLFLAGLRRIGATRTAVLSLCEPLAATLLAAVMLGQQPAPAQLLGAALLVCAGIAVQAAPAFPGPRSQKVQPGPAHGVDQRRRLHHVQPQAATTP